MTGVRAYLTADGGSVAAERDGRVVADGRMRRAKAGWDATLTLTPDEAGAIDEEGASAVLLRLEELAAPAAHGPLRWIVSAPTDRHDRAAEAAGLRHRRDLWQMRRALPVEDELRAPLPPIATRPFRVGVDEDAWLRANNRSFAEHPDQSGQERSDLEHLEHQHWFDPDGFLLLDAPDRPGELDGFCWTKVHPPSGDTPALGEIFVIGVDPSTHGRRLGPALTVAGLDHLAARGIAVGMLYVDEENRAAVRMYLKLAFTIHHVDRIYSP